MNEVTKPKLICPDCGYPLVEIGHTANSYEGQPDIPNVWAWKSYSCGCFMTHEETEAHE